jgi:hypothetical protein
MEPAIQAGRCAECSAVFRLNGYATGYSKEWNISTGRKKACIHFFLQKQIQTFNNLMLTAIF